MALLYQGCCVAPVWQGARAWLPRTVHYQPTERQDATDAGRGASALVLQKVASEFHPKVRNHGEGPY